MVDRKLLKIVNDIKSLKIQGAEHIARAAVDAWESAKDKKNASKLLLKTGQQSPC